jgi:transcriptional regulator with XRE-family HTH domain
MKQEAASATPAQRARLALGMTLLELAAECESRGVAVSEGQLSRIERGVFNPRPRLRAVLADVLGLNAVDDFEVTAR